MEDTSLTETEYLVTGIEDPSKNPTGWNGPYLDRWPVKNPWGGKYHLVSNYPDSGIYLKLDKVPSGAAQKMGEDLGEEIVKIDENDSSIVYLLISKY